MSLRAQWTAASAHFFWRTGSASDPDVRIPVRWTYCAERNGPRVRRTLCAVAQLDRNPGVRIKALEALQGCLGSRFPPSPSRFAGKRRQFKRAGCHQSSYAAMQSSTSSARRVRSPTLQTRCGPLAQRSQPHRSPSKAPPPCANSPLNALAASCLCGFLKIKRIYKGHRQKPHRQSVTGAALLRRPHSLGHEPRHPWR